MMTMKGGNEEPANIQLRLISLLQTQIGRKNTYRLVYQYIYTRTLILYRNTIMNCVIVIRRIRIMNYEIRR